MNGANGAAPMPTMAPTNDPMPDPGPHADFLAGKWDLGIVETLQLDATGRGSIDSFNYDTYVSSKGGFKWTSDGQTFFTKNGSDTPFGLSSNCRVIQLDSLTFKRTSAINGTCPTSPAALSSTEKGLVGKWALAGQYTDTWIVTMELEADRFGEQTDFLGSALQPDVMGAWSLSGNTLTIKSPRGNKVFQVNFESAPAEYVKGSMNYDHQNWNVYLKRNSI